MAQEAGHAVKEHCPDAWVINYTNPMTICVKTLYNVFVADPLVNLTIADARKLFDEMVNNTKKYLGGYNI